MNDGYVYFRVIQYLESQGVTDTSRFELRLQPDDSVTIVRWDYVDVQAPDLRMLCLTVSKNEAMAIENLRLVRRMRNEMLVATDYFFLHDSTVEVQDRAGVAAFRNRLRELPATIPDPSNLLQSLAMFPEPPTILLSTLVVKYPQIFTKFAIKRQKQ